MECLKLMCRFAPSFIIRPRRDYPRLNKSNNIDLTLLSAGLDKSYKIDRISQLYELQTFILNVTVQLWHDNGIICF